MCAQNSVEAFAIAVCLAVYGETEKLRTCGYLLIIRGFGREPPVRMMGVYDPEEEEQEEVEEEVLSPIFSLEFHFTNPRCKILTDLGTE